MASTFNSRAISGKGFLAPLYCMTEVREMTRGDWTFARSVINWSVMPSAKNSSDGSPDKFSRGRTAMEFKGRAALIGGEPVRASQTAKTTTSKVRKFSHPFLFSVLLFTKL